MSLFFAYDVDEKAVGEVLPRALLSDRGWPMVVSLDRDMKSTRHHAYVVNVWGSDSRAAACRMEEVVASFAAKEKGSKLWAFCLTVEESTLDSPSAAMQAPAQRRRVR